jgi:hypothetical protein
MAAARLEVHARVPSGRSVRSRSALVEPEGPEVDAVNFETPTISLTEQVEYLILWASRQARRERRRYRIGAVATKDVGWYYHALPEEEWKGYR